MILIRRSFSVEIGDQTFPSNSGKKGLRSSLHLIGWLYEIASPVLQQKLGSINHCRHGTLGDVEIHTNLTMEELINTIDH